MRLPDGWRAVSMLNALRIAGIMAVLLGIGLCFYRMTQISLTLEKEREARQRQHALYVAGWHRLMSLPRQQAGRSRLSLPPSRSLRRRSSGPGPDW